MFTSSRAKSLLAVSLATTALFALSSCASTTETLPTTTVPSATRPILISAENFELPVIGSGTSQLPATVQSADDVAG